MSSALPLPAPRRGLSGPNTVELWLLDAEQIRALAQRAREVLPERELERAPVALRDANTRRLWEGRQTALRLILAGRLDADPRTLSLEREPLGKPRLPEHPDQHFSVSGSEGWWLGAFCGRPVGVDVEVLRPMMDLRSVAKAYFNEGEMACLDAAPDAVERLRCFYHFWTRKEALVKLKGQGISGLAALRERELQGIWMEELILEQGLAANLALAKAPAGVVRRCWNDEGGSLLAGEPTSFRRAHSHKSAVLAPPPRGAYWLSEQGEAEAERLRLQAAIFLSEEVPPLLETLPEHGCFVDLGCGVGVLADAVAAARPDAGVFGYDMDPVAVRKSEQGTRKLGNLNFGLRRIEEGPPPGFFGADAANLRLVLMHHPDAVELLRAARAWLRTGGTLHVVEVDDRAMDFDPLPAWMPELLDLMQQVQMRRGGSRRLGQDLPGLLDAAGWRVLGQREVFLDPNAAVAALPKVFSPVGDFYLDEAERLGVGSGDLVHRMRAGFGELRNGRLPLAKIKVPFFHVWAQAQ